MEVGTVIGGAGLLVTVGFGLFEYQKRKQADQQRKAMEQRLERKEELEGLSDELAELNGRITTFCDHLLQPRLHEDMEFALHNLGTDVLSYVHAANENPTLAIEEVRIRYYGERKDAIPEDVGAVLDFYSREDREGMVRVGLEIPEGEEALSYPVHTDIDGGLNEAGYVIRKMQEVQAEYQGLLANFDSSLMADVEEATGQVVLASCEQVFTGKEGVEVVPDEYEDPLQLEDAIYEEFLLSEDVYSAVEELREVAERVDEVQTDVIKTSFS